MKMMLGFPHLRGTIMHSRTNAWELDSATTTDHLRTNDSLSPPQSGEPNSYSQDQHNPAPH